MISEPRRPLARLAQIAPMEVFNIVWVKLPILAAVFLASPWVLYQVWGFISPGLYKRERRWAAPFVLCTAGLFILGGAFVGVANETIDNSAGSAGDKSINLTKSGSFVFKAVAGFTPAIGDIGKEVYANTDWEVQVATAGLTNQYKVGTLVAIETTSTGASGVRVRVDNYSL